MQEVHDVDRYRGEYLPGLRPFLKKHGAEVLVAGFDAEPAEGAREEPGEVTGACYPQHPHQEFLAFLNRLVKDDPRQRLHVEIWSDPLTPGTSTANELTAVTGRDSRSRVAPARYDTDDPITMSGPGSFDESHGA